VAAVTGLTAALRCSIAPVCRRGQSHRMKMEARYI